MADHGTILLGSSYPASPLVTGYQVVPPTLRSHLGTALMFVPVPQTLFPTNYAIAGSIQPAPCPECPEPAQVPTEGIIWPTPGIVAYLEPGMNDAIEQLQADVAALQHAITGYPGANNQTGTSYTVVADDAGRLVTLNSSSPVTVTLPQDSAAVFPLYSRIDFAGLGTGLVTFAAGTGATVNGTPSRVTRARYSAASAVKVAANTWLVVGDMA